MEVEKIKTAANQKKKAFEKVHVWSFYYEKDEKKYSCAHYSKFKKNTGAYIFSEETANQDEILHAYKKMALSTSLFNRISRDMRDHYSKRLVYFVDLRHLLQEWQKEAPIEANLFSMQIEKYVEVVQYYERTQKEIYDLHQGLNKGLDRIEELGKLTGSDADIIMANAAKFSYLLYCQLCHQRDSIQWIRDIDTWLKQYKRQSTFGKKSLLIKYTDYYINEKSVGFLMESLKDFSKFENDPPLYLMDRESGVALHLKLFREQQEDIFIEEFIPILRTDYFVKDENDRASWRKSL